MPGTSRAAFRELDRAGLMACDSICLTRFIRPGGWLSRYRDGGLTGRASRWKPGYESGADVHLVRATPDADRTATAGRPRRTGWRRSTGISSRQSRALVVALFGVGMLTALVDSLIPVFVGRVVSLVSHMQPDELWRQAHWQLVGMAAVMLVGRPIGLLLLNLVHQPGHRARHDQIWCGGRATGTSCGRAGPSSRTTSPGRIANRVMQVGPALRESIVADDERGLVHRRLWRQRQCCCWATPMSGWPFPSRCGSSVTRCCCVCSCRGRGTGPAGCRKSAPG